MNRGLMVVVSLCHLVGDRPLTAEEEQLAFTLGWCIELVRNLFLVLSSTLSQYNEHTYIHTIIAMEDINFADDRNQFLWFSFSKYHSLCLTCIMTFLIRKTRMRVKFYG